MPVGFDDVEEVQLHKPNALIPDETSRELKKWWFEVPGGLGPNWDIISQCSVRCGRNVRQGVMLVEAKAHGAELVGEAVGKKLQAGARGGSRRNHDRIGKDIEEANDGLRLLTGDMGWLLSRDSCYQMPNRFTWAWSLASLGTTVVMVYLGFLNANEMSDIGESFRRHADWVECVKTHTRGKIPGGAWDRFGMAADGTSFVPRIMSASLSLTANRM